MNNHIALGLLVVTITGYYMVKGKDIVVVLKSLKGNVERNKQGIETIAGKSTGVGKSFYL
jgi:hypothetical protein